MKLSKKYQIDKCTISDKGRPALDYIHFDGQRLIATDGYKLVSLPVDEAQNDEPCLIPASAITEARKGKKDTSIEITSNGNVKIESCRKVTEAPIVQVYDHQSTDQYPDCTRLFTEAKAKVEKPLFQVAFNVNFLKSLADGMGVDTVVLTFTQHDFIEENGKIFTNKMIPVQPALEDDKKGQFGILMPTSL